MTDVKQLAIRLDEAVRTATAIPQLSASVALSLAEAYDVQRAGIALRARRDDRQVGVKLGFTSRAKAEQMGVDDVIIGVLTASMAVPDRGNIDVAMMIHPRIEPEVAFRLARAIDPHDSDDDPLTAVDAVAPALEVIDSRYRDFRFALADVVADNTSAAGFVVGRWQPLDAVDLADLEVTLSVDGQVLETGSTRDILGHPKRALTAVKRMASQHGLALDAGAVILAGAATAAVPLAAGANVQAVVGSLGEVAAAATSATHHG